MTEIIYYTKEMKFINNIHKIKPILKQYHHVNPYAMI
jgi:hypothetical protein